ncbi:MAG: hypothetical protein ACO1NU_08740 [Arcticibacter sp.]
MIKDSISGVTLRDNFGAFITSGLDDLLRMHDTKERFLHDWGDENGIEFDRKAPVYFKEKRVTLEIVMMGNSEADFWNKYKGFFTLITKPGTFRLYLDELSRSFYCYYHSSTSFRKLTYLKHEEYEGIGVKFNLVLIEPEPSFWKQFTFLTDKNGNRLITTDNYALIVTE